MPRVRDTRPTDIYWLYDMRPSTTAEHGPAGFPFYCGKTVVGIERRLTDHIATAKHRPSGLNSPFLRECEYRVRTELIESVPYGQNWMAREEFWIARLREINPNCTNLSSGGNGGTRGVQLSDAHKAAIGAANRNRVITHEYRANLSAGIKSMNPERRAELNAALRKRRISDETRELMIENIRKHWNVIGLNEPCLTQEAWEAHFD